MNDELAQYLVRYPPKETLIEEGGEEQDFFCLLGGTVGIWKRSEDDPSKKIKVGVIDTKGSYFGEMSYLLGEKRTASILAEDEVTVLKFPGEMLSQMIQKQPKLGLKLCTALADRLKGTTDKQKETALIRDELRSDSTHQAHFSKESFQKVFLLLHAIQKQFRHPLLAAVIDYMAKNNKLLQGGKRLKIDQAFLRDLSSPQLAKLVENLEWPET